MVGQEMQIFILQDMMEHITDTKVYILEDKLICPLPDDNPFIIVIELEHPHKTDFRHCFNNIKINIFYDVDKKAEHARPECSRRVKEVKDVIMRLMTDLYEMYPENGPWQGGGSDNFMVVQNLCKEHVENARKKRMEKKREMGLNFLLTLLKTL